MQKKEQEVCVSLQGKHSWDNIFVTKNKILFRNAHQKTFFDPQVSCKVTAYQHIFKSGLNLSFLLHSSVLALEK